MLIPSKPHRIRIGTPLTRELDKLAQDFFSDEVGLALYLQDARSQALQKGKYILENVVERFPTTALGTKVATALARGAARPFNRVVRTPDGKARLQQQAPARPEEALALTDKALEFLKGQDDKQNFAYGRLVRRRAQYYQQLGQADQAKREIYQLNADLARRGANPSVIEANTKFSDSLGDNRA